VTLALPAKAHAQQNKVSVCHITETYDVGSGPIAIGNEISIAEPALDAHIAHGDTQNSALTSLPQGTVVCVPDNGGNPDTDNDGQTDADEIACGSDPFSASNTARDIDGDNQPDCVDPDDDNDGVPDDQDVFPNDPSESDDSDGDGVGDNADQGPRYDWSS
jgi:hypothetical protein